MSSKVRRDYTPYIVLSLPVLFLSVFLFVPLGVTFLRAFAGPGFGIDLQALSLENFFRFGESRLYQRALRNSLLVSTTATLFSVLIGVPMAYIAARVPIPFRRVVLSLGVLPIITPSFVAAFSWVIMLGRQGVLRLMINRILSVVGLEIPSIYGIGGVVFVMTVTYYPFVFLLVYGAFRSANPLLEQAASIMGATRWRITRTVTLPLVLPSIGAGALLVFILALGDFGVPAVIGGDQYVLPTLIYFRVSGFWDLNGAAAIAMVSMVITGGALFLQKYVISRREYESLGNARPEELEHRGFVWRAVGTLFCSIVLVVSLLPQISMAIMSFFTHWRGLFPTGFTLSNYLAIPQVAGPSIRNSLFMATTASLATAVIGCLVAYITARRKPPGSAILDFAVMAPFILPGTVIAVAILAAFGQGPVIAIGGTYLIIIISFVIRRTPYTFRSVVASLTQLDPKLEESSIVSGASWFYTFRRVSLPLILNGVISGTVLTFATLLQELSTTILLYSARTRTVPVLIYGRVADGRFGEASALAVLLIATVFVVVYLTNRLLGTSFASSFRLG
jgi:iron(III) transport system permease protein